MSSRNSLSDDWEDVGDDNLSVVSLATTDPEADAAAPTTTSTSELDAAHAEPQPAQAPNAHHPTTPTQTFQLPIRSAPQQIDDPSETQEESPDDPFGDPPSYEHHDDDDDDELSDSAENAVNVNELSEALDETSLDDTVDVDPTLLQKELQSLHDILDQTANILRSSVPGLQNPTRWKALGFVGVLFNQAKELMPIISGYAKAWSSASSPQDLPIDPSLHGWLSGVRVKVLGLQAEVRSISRGARDCVPPPAATERPNLDAILLDLENYEKKMTDFLPIIRVDFNEFLTQKMTIPIASPSPIANISNNNNNNRSKSGPVVTIDRSSPIDIPQPSCTSTGTSSQAPGEKSTHQGPSNEVWLLRHELYRLKDLIQQTMERLSYKTGLSNSGCGLASDISGMYGKLFTKLSTTLTNHGSDWIESYLEGGLTYPEFLGLDVDCIRDFAGQLRVTMNGMPISASEAWPEGWAAQLERLEILVMVLSATLTPDRD